MLTDGTVKEYSANITAVNLFTQIDQADEKKLLICEIIDHKTDGSAVHADDMTLTHKDGKVTQRHTTKGWWLCVWYRDESILWVKLKDLKNSNPLKLAEYAVANN